MRVGMAAQDFPGLERMQDMPAFAKQLSGTAKLGP
jgi:hypothetical protein